MVAHSSLIAPIWVSAILEVRLRLNMPGSPFAYTWAAHPRYRMTGCHTWGGTFSGPVGVSREESKNSLDSGNLLLLPIYACVDGPLRSTRKTPSVASIMMDPPPSPRAKLAMPVRALMASDAQLPAGLSAPGPQFRKNLWPLRNYRPELDFWRCRKSFRNWGPGSKGNPGNWYADNVRAHTHTFGQRLTSGGGANYGNPTSQWWFELTGDAAKTASYGGKETAPVHIYQPVMIYLGRSSQV